MKRRLFNLAIAALALTLLASEARAECKRNAYGIMTSDNPLETCDNSKPSSRGFGAERDADSGGLNDFRSGGRGNAFDTMGLERQKDKQPEHRDYGQRWKSR